MSRGLAWIEEDTGRVVKTELRIGGRTSPISIITEYKLDEELGIKVPVAMRDWYPDGTGEIRGVATYGRFRRFQVKTTEEAKEGRARRLLYVGSRILSRASSRAQRADELMLRVGDWVHEFVQQFANVVAEE